MWSLLGLLCTASPWFDLARESLRSRLWGSTLGRLAGRSILGTRVDARDATLA